MKRAGVDWLLPDEAIRAIMAGREAGIPVLGFDGAYVRETTTKRSMADSSPVYPSVPDPYADAIRIISERAESGLRFEVVLEQENSD